MHAMMKSLYHFLLLLTLFAVSSNGILFPKDSPSRLVKELGGVWHFMIDNSPSRNVGFDDQWYSKPLGTFGQTIMMPVPASYNDITQNSTIRDFVGWAWYERQFWVPGQWLDGKTRVVLRFESAHYNTIVWVNGKQVMEHSGGHLPFEADIANALQAGQSNRLTVAVNNTLTPHTLPPGEVEYIGPPDYIVQKFRYFFNYAGIHRPVKLYTTPTTYIDDIAVVTTLKSDGSADLNYQVKVGQQGSGKVSCTVDLLGGSASQTSDVSNGGVSGTLNIKDPSLWWPWTMSDSPGNLYPFEVNCTNDDNKMIDYYRLAVGLREVNVTETQFLINGKPFYLNGVDKHEDWDIFGKGMNYALTIKDVNLLKWLGVAAFRTSHYPYSEEILELCDQEGIAVILESPAVGQRSSSNYDDEVLKHHMQVMTEMYNRDKNRPSVVMWSVANEPDSSLKEAGPYFQKIVELTHSLDSTRPVTFACNNNYKTELACQYMDVIMLNQYFGWYLDIGHPELIDRQMRNKLDDWYGKFKKPIMVSEYGAETLPGTHKDPPSAWSEEYQVQVLTSHWSVFDDYRKKFFVGELIWNFADFAMPQDPTWPNGNHKGVLTRQRQPKLAAHFVRERYMALAQGRDYHPESVYPK